MLSLFKYFFLCCEILFGTIEIICYKKGKYKAGHLAFKIAFVSFIAFAILHVGEGIINYVIVCK